MAGDLSPLIITVEPLGLLMVPGLRVTELSRSAEMPQMRNWKVLLSHVPEGIESPQRCLAEAFCSAFSINAAAAFDGLAVGFEPPVN